MPISPMTFENLPVPQRVNPVARALQSALQMYQQGADTAYMLPNLKADLEKKQLENTINQPKADYAKQITLADLFNKRANTALTNQQAKFYEPDIMSQIGFRNAQASAIPTEIGLNQQKIKEALIKNRYLDQKEQADIKETNARGDYYKMGGGKGGVGTKEELFFQNLVSMDNPQLTPDQVYEASNVLRSGGDTLKDGTKLNALSPASRESYNRLTKGGSTSAVVTGNIRANQADAEINAISKYAQEGLKPYGKTYFNKSPQQIIDSFKSDDESQTRLGRFIASQQLQYEIAQNEIKLAMGQPGITSTQELMQLGQQLINTSYPQLSYKARQEAQRYFIEALQKGLEARNSVGIGASSAASIGNKNSGNYTAIWKRDSNGKMVRQ